MDAARSREVGAPGLHVRPHIGVAEAWPISTGHVKWIGGKVEVTMPEATYREIARRANVSVAAVSFALRNRPGVSPATRKHILAVAKECGYTENPFVTALMTHKRAARPQKIQAIMGMVTYASLKSVKHFPHSTAREFYNGAKSSAADLGFVLEEFILDDLRANPNRIATAFYTRRMNGLLFHVGHEVPDWFQIGWENFACLSLGHRLITPPMDFVSSDHLADMRLALAELLALGYRRIAFLATKESQELQGDRYLSGFLGRAWEHAFPMPLLVPESAWEPQSVVSWVKKQKPDVVITQDTLVLRWLRDAGIRVPEDVALVHLDLDATWGDEVAGIRQQSFEVGREAINILAGHINRSDFGLPKTPHASLIAGLWSPGQTAPPVSSRPQSSRSPRRKKLSSPRP